MSPNRAGKTPLLTLFQAGITLATTPLRFLLLEEDMDRGAEEEEEEVTLEVEVVGVEGEEEDHPQDLPVLQEVFLTGRWGQRCLSCST